MISADALLRQQIAPPAAAALTAGRRAELGFAARARLIQLRGEITSRFLEMGELLDVVHQYRLWEGYAESFAAFCADPEMALTPSAAYRILRTYRAARTFGLLDHPLIGDLGIEKLSVVLPRAQDREDALARLTEAVALPTRELLLLYRGDDPQAKAVEALLVRFCTMTSPARLALMVRAYFALTYDERLAFWGEVTAARERAQRADRALPSGNGDVDPAIPVTPLIE